jgi:hypothetical protein
VPSSRAGRRRAEALALLLVVARAATASAGEGDVVHEAAPNYPLVFTAQGDAVLASDPHTPEDPPPGTRFDRGRLRIGEDITVHLFRLRAVLEARAAGGGAPAFSDVEGGRLAGPLRLTEAFVAFVPGVAFSATAGVLRAPFSLSRQIDDADVRFPVRAPIIQAVAPDLRAGAGVSGDLGAMNYRAAAFAASPTLDGRLFDHGALFAARLGAEPIGPVGFTPWRRSSADPWYGWFRFAVGLSVMNGSVAGLTTRALGVDLQAQWRRFVASGEYIYAHATGLAQHGAVIEPGVSLLERRLFIAARGDWHRLGATSEWGAGAAITIIAPDPRLRAQIGFERRTTAAGLQSGWAIARLTVALD